jgi:hypothetical protein
MGFGLGLSYFDINQHQPLRGSSWFYNTEGQLGSPSSTLTVCLHYCWEWNVNHLCRFRASPAHLVIKFTESMVPMLFVSLLRPRSVVQLRSDLSILPTLIETG